MDYPAVIGGCSSRMLGAIGTCVGSGRHGGAFLDVMSYNMKLL